jgi:hypothetical protein
MMNKYPSYRSQPSSAASDVWFISFGDLLTLLVCFFLVLTPKGSLSGESAKYDQAVSEVAVSTDGSGTKVAGEGSIANLLSAAIEVGLRTDQKSYTVLVKRNSEAIRGAEGVFQGIMPVTKSVAVSICGEVNRMAVLDGVLQAVQATPTVLQRLSFELLDSCSEHGEAELAINDNQQQPLAILRFTPA